MTLLQLFQEYTAFMKLEKVKTQVSLEGLRSFLRHISVVSCLSNLSCFSFKTFNFITQFNLSLPPRSLVVIVKLRSRSILGP